jgi:hypothetical protein
MMPIKLRYLKATEECKSLLATGLETLNSSREFPFRPRLPPVPARYDHPVIRVELPFHLCTLSGVRAEVQLDLDGSPTLGSVLDALEARYPVLRGTIRDHTTLRRRPFLRFFACGMDLSHESPDTRLPEAVAAGFRATLEALPPR